MLCLAWQHVLLDLVRARERLVDGLDLGPEPLVEDLVPGQVVVDVLRGPVGVAAELERLQAAHAAAQKPPGGTVEVTNDGGDGGGKARNRNPQRESRADKMLRAENPFCVPGLRECV